MIRLKYRKNYQYRYNSVLNSTLNSVLTDEEMTVNSRIIELKVLDNYSISKSSQEVTFSSITCDFTGYTAEDLPEKYQEVTLEENGKVLFFGYIDEYTFPAMREVDLFTEIEFTLLSPMKLATLRTVLLSGTYKLNELIPEVLQPLIDDGFTIVENEITDRTVTVNFPLNTVEYCMNNLSNKFNFWWFIDELKQIHIKDISLMLNQKPNYTYDDNNKIPYLQYIKPTVYSEGYANVVNFKNVRVYENSIMQFSGSTITEAKNELIDSQLTTPIKPNDELQFNYPCDIKQENIIKSAQSNGIASTWQHPILYGLRIKGTYSNNSTFDISISYNQLTNTYTKSNSIGFNDKESDKEKAFLLIRDSFFSNLITGIRYNGTTNIQSLSLIQSDSILVYNIDRMYNDSAIYSKKDIVSKSGIVETTIDMQESWKTLQELREIGNSFIEKNSLKLDGELQLKIDTSCNMNVGNTIKINKMLFDSTYIITNIQLNYVDNYKEWIVTCKNGNILTNYIDVFRGENTQENEENTYKVSIIHYVEDEIKEVFEVVK